MGNIPAMSNLGERLKSSREALNLSQTTVGKACGVSRAAVSQWENGVTVPTRENMEAAADVLRVDFYWLLTGKDKPSISPDERIEGETKVSSIPVVGIVEAGIWRECDLMSAEPSEYLDMPEDPRYQGFPRRAVRVSGDSVNQDIPDGGYAVFVPIAEYGKNPEHGQLVIAERIMHQGGLVEATIKEYRRNGKSVELWPKSDNPKHSQPVKLSPVRGAEDVEVRIVGVVVAKYVPM